MKGCIYLIVSALLIVSCNSGSDNAKKTVATIKEVPAGNTPNQRRGMGMITSFYGGTCKVMSGTIEMKADTVRYIKVEMSNSGPLDSAMNITELNAANIALVFYNSLLNEAASYDEIRTQILFGDGQSVEKRYPMHTLATVIRKSKVVNDIVETLKNQKYDALDTLLNDKNGIRPFDKKILIAQIKNADPPLGKIISFIPYGFVFFKAGGNKDVLRMAGMMMRDGKAPTQFSVEIDTSTDRDEAIFVNYTLGGKTDDKITTQY